MVWPLAASRRPQIKGIGHWVCLCKPHWLRARQVNSLMSRLVENNWSPSAMARLLASAAHDGGWALTPPRIQATATHMHPLMAGRMDRSAPFRASPALVWTPVAIQHFPEHRVVDDLPYRQCWITARFAKSGDVAAVILVPRLRAAACTHTRERLKARRDVNLADRNIDVFVDRRTEGVEDTPSPVGHGAGIVHGGQLVVAISRKPDQIAHELVPMRVQADDEAAIADHGERDTGSKHSRHSRSVAPRDSHAFAADSARNAGSA